MHKKPTCKELEQKVEALEEELIKGKTYHGEFIESEGRYKKLLDFVPYPVMVVSFDGQVSYLNIDLLRVKIFSERYNFKISMTSSRCKFIPKKCDICPGSIDNCSFCNKKEDCYNSGGTIFYLNFPAIEKKVST